MRKRGQGAKPSPKWLIRIREKSQKVLETLIVYIILRYIDMLVEPTLLSIAVDIVELLD